MLLRLRQSQTKPDHRRPAHRTPEVEIEIPIPGRAGIVGGGTQAGDDQQIAGIAQQFGGDGATVEGAFSGIANTHFTNTLAPIRRWESSTATGIRLSNASAAA